MSLGKLLTILPFRRNQIAMSTRMLSKVPTTERISDACLTLVIISFWCELNLTNLVERNEPLFATLVTDHVLIEHWSIPINALLGAEWWSSLCNFVSLFHILLFDKPILSLDRCHQSAPCQTRKNKDNRHKEVLVCYVKSSHIYRFCRLPYWGSANAIIPSVVRVALWLVHLVRSILHDWGHGVSCRIRTADRDFLCQLMIWPSFCVFALLPPYRATMSAVRWQPMG